MVRALSGGGGSTDAGTPCSIKLLAQFVGIIVKAELNVTLVEDFDRLQWPTVPAVEQARSRTDHEVCSGWGCCSTSEASIGCSRAMRRRRLWRRRAAASWPGRYIDFA
jgi:hypothetical protein